MVATERKLPSPPGWMVSKLAISWNLVRIRADKAWERCRGTNVKVGVLDTGIDTNHPALAENVKRSYDAITDKEIVDYDDGVQHGTHVAGIIAANNKGMEKVGVAPEAFLYCFKVLEDDGFGHPSAVIRAIELCMEIQVQIVNMSFGVPDDNLSLRDALRRAADAGILLVAAAGNEGRTSTKLLFPAAYDFVIAVTATNTYDQLSPFSSRGPEVNLCAPGQDTMSTDRYSHLPEWVRGAVPDGNFSTWPGEGGTSFAAPHVTGAAALVISVNPLIKSHQVRSILEQTAENLTLPSDEQGQGLVDAAFATQKASTLRLDG